MKLLLIVFWLLSVVTCLTLPPRSVAVRTLAARSHEEWQLESNDDFYLNYEFTKTIVFGPNAIVMVVRDKQHREFVCKLVQAKKSQVENEVHVLRKLAHPGIIGVERFFDLGGNTFAILLEYLGDGWSDLAEYIDHYGPLSVSQAWFIFKQVYAVLKFVHRNQIVHCDIKGKLYLLRQKHHD
jgi:serine/threonine protein kinase